MRKTSMLYRSVLTAIIFGGSFIVSNSAMADATGAAKPAYNVGEVTDATTEAVTPAEKQLKKANPLLTKKKVFNATQSELFIGKKSKKYVSPVGGAAQLLTMLPGVHIMSQNPAAAAGRDTITINGMGIGWWSGITYRNQIQALFDGIPMNNQTSNDGQWNTNQIPILGLVHGVDVIYGPGNPKTRWYDSIGGTINYVPVQPKAKASAKVGLTYGSQNSLNTYFTANTGLIDGWATVLGGGYTTSNSYTHPYTFPEHAWAIYLKTTHPFQHGYASFGFYMEKALAGHTFQIPISPVKGYSINGYDLPGEAYSQSTSGYHSVVSPSLWYKYDEVNSYILYAKQGYDFSKKVVFRNKLWYRYSHRLHQANFDYYVANENPETVEHYNPSASTFGDRVNFDFKLPMNVVQIGGFFSTQRYHTTISLYNPVLGTSQNNPHAFNNDLLNSTFASIYLQDRFHALHDRLQITPGISLATFNTSMVNLGAPSTKTLINNTLTRDTSTSFTKPEPSVGINYHITHHIALYGNYAVTYQNATDLAYGAYLPSINILSNKIKLTKNTDYEAGIRYLAKGLSININYYHDYLTNLLNGVFGSGLGSFNDTGFSLGNAIYNGVNLAASWRPIYNAHLFGTLNVQHSYYTKDYNSSGQSFSGYSLSGIPDYSMTVGASYKIVLPGGILIPRIVDHYYAAQTLFDNVTGGPTRIKTAPYNLLNLSLSYRTDILNQWIPDIKDASFSLSGYNILGRNYESSEEISRGYKAPTPVIFAYPGSGSQVFFTAHLRF
jgi:Outer membrane receptor proteins, mostly Fe transport